jgi:hypothetical protein
MYFNPERKKGLRKGEYECLPLYIKHTIGTAGEVAQKTQLHVHLAASEY